jgi:hypothetical protein
MIPVLKLRRWLAFSSLIFLFGCGGSASSPSEIKCQQGHMGNAGCFLDYVYTRPSSNIRVDFAQNLDRSYDLNQAEIGTLVALLDTLGDEEMRQIREIRGQSYTSSSGCPTFAVAKGDPDRTKFAFLFALPSATRPLYPQLTSEFLTVLRSPGSQLSESLERCRRRGL